MNKKKEQRPPDGTPESEATLKTWSDELAPSLRLMRIVNNKKYKRLAKGIESYLSGGVENSGTILALIAGSVAIERKPDTLSLVRQKLLRMWQELGYVTEKEISDRE